jgi:hypothetical protein
VGLCAGRSAHKGFLKKPIDTFMAGGIKLLKFQGSELSGDV